MDTSAAGKPSTEAGTKARVSANLRIKRGQASQRSLNIGLGLWPHQLSVTTGSSAPDIDAYREGESFCIVADVPGAAKDDLEVAVSGAEVVISGRRKAPEQTDRRYIVQERFHGGFTRAIALPPGAEPEKMEAVLQDGVLRITVPVAAAQATVTIPVR